MRNIIEAFKDVYTGKNKWVSHAILFTLAGILGILTITEASYYSQIKNLTSKNTNLSEIINLFGHYFICEITTLFFGIIILGFSLTYIHNKWQNQQGIPEFSVNTLKVGFMGFLIKLGWSFIFVLLGILCIIPILILFMISKPLGGILYITLILAIIVSASFLPFLLIKFSKNYDMAGLFNIKNFISYIKLTFLDFVITSSKMIIALLPIFLAIGLIYFLIGLCNRDNSNEIIQLTFAILVTYCGAISQLVWFNCLTKIYKNKIEV